MFKWFGVGVWLFINIKEIKIPKHSLIIVSGNQLQNTNKYNHKKVH